MPYDWLGNMDKKELERCLSDLNVSQVEAARHLSVNPRTFRRWMEVPEEIPGPAERALRAWQRLSQFGLSWRPDAIAFGEESPDLLDRQMQIHRNHSVDLAAVISRVKERGGPVAPWIVDLRRRRATLGNMQIAFYALEDGTFSPASYIRADRDPDLNRDEALIEDGLFLIAQQVAKSGPDWARQENKKMSSGLRLVVQPPAYNPLMGTLRVPATDGDQLVLCTVHRALLEQLCGRSKLSETALKAAFEKYRKRIELALRQKHAMTGIDRDNCVRLNLGDHVLVAHKKV